MTFKIISCGWNCEQFIPQTLQSVENQTYRDFEHYVSLAVRPGDEGSTRLLEDWGGCERPYFHWRYVPEDVWDIPNRYGTILWANPKDDDVIVFLDLDGDQLLPHSLQYLADVYTDPTLLMTYGNYTWEPHTPGPSLAKPFPGDVIDGNTFRQHILYVGQTYNHLRTMKGRLFWNIPIEQYKWPGTNDWYRHGTDYVFTVPALELAGRRQLCLEEVLMIYNEGNPLSNVHTMWKETERCTQNFLRRPPLEPLR